MGGKIFLTNKFPNLIGLKVSSEWKHSATELPSLKKIFYRAPQRKWYVQKHFLEHRNGSQAMGRESLNKVINLLATRDN